MGFTTPDFPDVEWNLAQVLSGSATDAEGTAAPLVGAARAQAVVSAGHTGATLVADATPGGGLTMRLRVPLAR